MEWKMALARLFEYFQFAVVNPTITTAIIKSINGNIVNIQSTIYLKIKLKNENNNMKIMKK